MIEEILKRLAVTSGLEDGTEVETARGISDSTWDGMKYNERRRYVKDHPMSRFALDPKYGFAKRKSPVKRGAKNTGVKKSVSLKDLKRALTDPRILKMIMEKLGGGTKAKRKVSSAKKKLSKGQATGNKQLMKDAAKEVLPAIKGIGIVKVSAPSDSGYGSDYAEGDFGDSGNVGNIGGNGNRTGIRGSKPSDSNRKNSNDRYGNYPYITDPKEIGKLFGDADLDYTVNEDGTVDTEGGDIIPRDFERLLDVNGHLKIKFGKVDGSFCCQGIGLTSLEGAPREVVENFICSNNSKLTSLKGAPEKVSGYFDCSHNGRLTSLEGSPRELGGDFICGRCKNLKSLEGAPEKVEYICVDEDLENEAVKKYGKRNVEVWYKNEETRVPLKPVKYDENNIDDYLDYMLNSKNESGWNYNENDEEDYPSEVYDEDNEDFVNEVKKNIKEGIKNSKDRYIPAVRFSGHGEDRVAIFDRENGEMKYHDFQSYKGRYNLDHCSLKELSRLKNKLNKLKTVYRF